MTDQETSQAVEALAHRVRVRDTALREGRDDLEDAELFAQEFILALKARGGWRPTPARVFPWKAATPGGGPPLSEETITRRQALHADMEARAAAARKARGAGDRPGAA